MARKDVKISDTTAKTIEKIADHFQCAEGYRPTRIEVVARISTFVWQLLNRGELTQENLVNGVIPVVPGHDSAADE